MFQLSLLLEDETKTRPEFTIVSMPQVEIKNAETIRVPADSHFLGWTDVELLRNGGPEAMEVFLTRYRKTLEGFPDEYRALVVAKWISVGKRYRVVRSTKLVTWLIYVGNNAIRDAERKLIRHEIGHKLFQRTTVEADTPYEMFIEADYLAWDFDRVDPDVAELARAVMSGEIEPDQLTDFERQSLRDAWETLQL
jgi:hypothetical protein